MRPQSLTDAYWLAKDVEPCHPPLPIFTKRTGVAYSNLYQKPIRNNVAQKFSTVSTVSGSQTLTKQLDTYQKIRKVGECWRCGDKWMHGHKCKLVPNVHLMQPETEEPVPQEMEDMNNQEPPETLSEGEQAMFTSAFAM